MDRSVAIQVAFVAVQSTSQVVVFRSLGAYLNYMEEGLASLFFVASVQVEMCKEALLFFLIFYTFMGPKSNHCLALVTQSLHPIVDFCFGCMTQLLLLGKLEYG